MRTEARRCVVSIGALLAAAGAACGQGVTFQAVPHGLNTTEYYAVSISNDGQMIGGYYGDDFGIYYGIRVSTAGAVVQYPDLCPIMPATRLFRISGNGNAAVGEMNWCDQDPECPGCGETGPGIWTEERGTQYIGMLPGGMSDFEAAMALDVSADGSVAVGYSSVQISDEEWGTHAFRWTPEGGIEDLGMPENAQYSRAIAVSDDGQTIVVEALMLYLNDEGVPVATPLLTFLWRQGEGYTQLPVPEGFDNVMATEISADGSTVVGRLGTRIGVNPPRGAMFRWRAATGMEVIEVPPELNRASGNPWGVNADGTVMVGDLIGAHPWIPFIWDETHGFRTIESVLTAGNVDYSDWEIRGVNAVSADGRTMVGTGFREHPEFGTVVDSWVMTLSDEPACPADWNGDESVNSADISAFLSAWLGSLEGGDLAADFDASGTVNSADISAFLSAWLEALTEGC